MALFSSMLFGFETLSDGGLFQWFVISCEQKSTYGMSLFGSTRFCVSSLSLSTPSGKNGYHVFLKVLHMGHVIQSSS